MLLGRDVWLNDQYRSSNLEEPPSNLPVLIDLTKPEDSSLCIITPTESIRCERDSRFEFGPEDSSDFFELNSRGDMVIPLHLSCLRTIEQVEQYRRLQDRCAPISPGSVELVYKALCRQKRYKAYLYSAPYTRVYMGEGDHDFHGVSSNPRKDISWIAIGSESVSNLLPTFSHYPFLQTNAFSEQSGWQQILSNHLHL